MARHVLATVVEGVNGDPVPSVALIVDHPQRDLGGLVLTAFTLGQRGITTYLVPHDFADEEVFTIAPDLALLQYARPGNESFARRLLDAGVRFGVLDTEGAVWPSERVYAGLLWRDAELRRKVHVVCMWGPHLARYLVDESVFASDQVVVTGCPRFDFYHRRWWSVLGGERARAPRKRILINTNFSHANPRFVTAAQHGRAMRERYGQSAEEVDRLFATESPALDAMLDLVRSLGRDFPAAEVVVRPHPWENTELYRQYANDLANVSIENGGPVQPEILSASVVIQRGCTTAIEAGLAGVPALSPLWINRAMPQPLAESVSVPCRSYAEMRSQVAAALGEEGVSKSSNGNALSDLIEQRFHRVDGRSHERVAQAVASALADAAGPSLGRCRRLMYRLDDPGCRSVHVMLRWVRYRLRLRPDWSFRRWKPVPRRLKPQLAFTADEVQGLLDRVASAVKGTGEQVFPIMAQPAKCRVTRRPLHAVHLRVMENGSQSRGSSQ